MKIDNKTYYILVPGQDNTNGYKIVKGVLISASVFKGKVVKIKMPTAYSIGDDWSTSYNGCNIDNYRSYSTPSDLINNEFCTLLK